MKCSFWKIWISTAVIVVLLSTIAYFLKFRTEGFEDNEANEAERGMQAALTEAAEAICKPQQYIWDDYSRTMPGESSTRAPRALMFMMKEAAGHKAGSSLPLFPCPVPSASEEVPANVGERFKNSLT